MPLYYDLNKTGGFTANGSAGSESMHMYAKTVANQETCAMKGIFLASRFATAGGAQLRVKTNTGFTSAGGTQQTPISRNLRMGSVAAQTTFFNDATAITVGTPSVNTRLTIGFAQTGGMGGWVPVEAPDALVMMPNTTNPVDMQFTSAAATASITFDMTVEFSEGY